MAKQLLNLLLDQELRMGAMDIARGCPEFVDSSTFVGYTGALGSMKEVNEMYAAVCKKEKEARHVICAVRLPGTDFHVLDDYNDNDEHGADRLLKKILRESEMQNRALFVTRHYDGVHIGPLQFDAIRRAAVSALTIGAYNNVIGEHQFPWSTKGWRGSTSIWGGQKPAGAWPSMTESKHNGTQDEEKI